MDKKVFCILILALLIMSMLSVVYRAEPTAAEGKLQDQASTLSNRIGGPFEENSGSSRDLSKNADAGLGLTGPNQYSNFTFLNGNKTRLVVGVGPEEQAKIFELEKIAARHQAEIVNTVKMGGKIRAIVFELLLASVTSFVEEVHTSRLASYVEPNMKFQAQFVPNDPYWSVQWGPQKIRADLAWDTTVGNSSILVAVVDTGIYYSHPDLAANYVALGRDWVNNDSDPVDDHGHGTHCAGIIAAVLNNSEGIAGLAQVRVMAEKVLNSGGGGYDDWVANGIVHATDSGADIISMSLGGYGDSELVHDAVKYAYDAGVLVIAAAGNDNTNSKSYPAGYEEVVAVAATDQNDNKASFSNWGDWIELAAPGVDIYSTVPFGYQQMSGTSMACPHVAGVAALTWSQYPNRTRDWVRMWLRYTASDLGSKGFDLYYGYGRIDAQQAVQTLPPAHELMAYSLTTPPYVKPGFTATINCTILNFGQDETDITVQLFANDIEVNSAVVGFLSGGNFATLNLTWTPTVEGAYNITFYIIPVIGETNSENNALQKRIYVGFPIKAVVLHSAGNIIGDIIINWQALSEDWQLFGDTMVYIDYTSLNKEGITYEDIASTEADVLIISCASDAASGWQFKDSEIDAITRYVHEGHGLVATSGTFLSSVPNNNKLAPLFGMNKTIMWSTTYTDLLHLLDTTHPFFASVPDPLVFPRIPTVVPSDGRWDSNELTNGEYAAIGHYQESAIAMYKGLIYISPILEIIPPYYHHHLQLFYNAIRYSRYEKPEHELAVDLQTPPYLKPGESALINATVSNIGSNNETNVNLYLLINNETVETTIVPLLINGTSQTIEYTWSPTTEGIYNITAYAPPVPNESEPTDNIITRIMRVRSVVGYVVFEEAHQPTYSIGNNPAADISGGYSGFANYLTLNGYMVSTIDPGTTITPSVLASIDVLVIVAPQWSYSPSELDAIENWVKGGGNLLLISDWVSWGYQARTIATRFGISMPGDGIFDSDDNVGWPGWVYYTGANILPHPVTAGVNRIEMYASDGITSASTDESKIVTTDSDGTAYWYGNGLPAPGVSVASAFEGQATGSGKLFLITDSNLWDSCYDVDGDGQIDFYDSDNEVLALNSVDWLSVRYQHELSVMLDAPDFVAPDSMIQLNATAQNRGLNNETNIELRLYVNDSIVDSIIIAELATGQKYTLSYIWTPSVEGIYNVTAYASPVSGEEYPSNNIATKLVSVRQIKRILFDQTHRTDGISNYNKWTASLLRRGYLVDTLSIAPITPDLLSGYDVFVISQAYVPYTPDELLVIQSFVMGGGGLLVIGDDNPYMYTDLTGFAGIYWVYGGTSGTTTDLTPHPVTAGVSSVQLVAPVAFMTVDGTGQGLVRDPSQNIMLAVSEQPPGKVLGFADEDTLMNYGITQADNLRLADNMIDWLSTSIPSDHDLVVSIEVPTFVEPGESVLINATVRNRGLNNETNLELQLLINDTRVDSANIPELLVGHSYTLHYPWAPAVEGTYNATAYTPPLSSEEFTGNNVMTKLVSVRQIRGFVLWDQTHYTDKIEYYSIWTGALIQRGYVVETLSTSPITSEVLEGHDVFIIPQAYNSYTSDELLAIQNFVNNGGGLLVIGDDYPNIYTDLTAFAGITWEVGGWSGITTDITPHPVTTGVFSVYLAGPASFINVSSPAMDLIRDQNGQVMLAVSAVGSGRVLGIADEDTLRDYSIGYEYNLRLANNMVDWLAAQRGGAHDIAVTNVAVSPNDIYNGWTVYANVTVANLGNVTEAFDVSLYYDNSLITTQYVSSLEPNATLDLSFSWNTNSVVAGQTYTVSAVASTVQGETDTTNNVFVDGSVEVRLFGDVNKDRTVDILDCVLAAKAFGATPSDLEWNMFCDLKQDNIIDIYDMILIAKYFGSSL